MDAETKKLIDKAMKMPKWDDVCVENFRKDPELMRLSIKSELEEFDKTGEIVYLLETLNKAAKAVGIAKLERETGITRAALYAVLKGKSMPRVDNLVKILHALGFSLSIKPLKKAA
jgi:probable addiction module antidote protein